MQADNDLNKLSIRCAAVAGPELLNASLERPGPGSGGVIPAPQRR
jgi:hypothetical protein